MGKKIAPNVLLTGENSWFALKKTKMASTLTRKNIRVKVTYAPNFYLKYYLHPSF